MACKVFGASTRPEVGGTARGTAEAALCCQSETRGAIVAAGKASIEAQ